MKPLEPIPCKGAQGLWRIPTPVVVEIQRQLATMTSQHSKPRMQCAKCPWKVDTDPYEIPNGYDVVKHRALSRTIAEPGSLKGLFDAQYMMACHETGKGAQLPCVGWLHHQLGVGNNLGLRLAVMSGRINGNIQIVGEQHACLEDTLPRPRRRKR